MTTLTEHTANLRKAGLPSVEALATRIVKVFDRATVSDVESGAVWYEDGKALAQQWATETGYSVEHCAAVLSHLSPRTPWTRNVMGAGTLLRTGEQAVGILTANYDRAVRSLDFEDPADSFGGPKTLRFYRNFLGDTEAVTVDVWACRVANVDDALLGRKGIYDAIEAAYQMAARRRGVEPTTMQAATWIVARNGRVG